MATPQRQNPRRRLWIAGVVGAALVLALVAVTVYSLTRPPSDQQTQPTVAPATPTQAPTGVDACLGGASPTAESLLAAQTAAPRTPEGAVSYAAAFARYALQIPTPTDADTVATTNGLSSDWWARWSESGTSWTGPNPLSVTTVNGSYRVDSFTPDEATVSLVLPWVVDGAISPSRTFEPSITLQRAVSGGWTVTDLQSAASSTSPGEGTPFSGGC